MRGLLGFVLRMMGTTDSYMRAYPAVPNGARVHETDLFEGVVNG